MIVVLSDLWVPFPGGAERLIFNITRDLYRRGHHLVVLTGYEQSQRFDGPPVVYRPIHDGPDLARYIDSIARDDAHVGEGLDLILTHHYWASKYEHEIMAPGVPVVQVVLNGRRLPGAALGIFISEWVRSQLVSKPFDLTMTPPAFDDVVADSHGNAIGFIKPIEHKGVELVYEIAARMPDRRFVILRGEWQDIEIIRPAPNIEFLEPVVDIRDFYARCRLVLMPSISEDAGTVAQECAMNGIPCLSSDVGGLRETNAGGVRLQHRDVGEWVEMIEALDDPGRYVAVAASQHAVTPTDQTALLDAIDFRIQVLRAKR